MYFGKCLAPSGKDFSGKWQYVREIQTKKIGRRFNHWVVAAQGNANHPAPFPEALARDHIKSWSNQGDIILDCFNGSGTTTKMARELGCRYIGIDVHEEYCEIARKRLQQGVFDFDS